MGTNLPSSRVDSLTWLESHVTTWSSIADPTTIGLSEAQIAGISAATVNARAAFDASQLARDNSKGATQLWHSQIDAARLGASGVIATIKSFAKATANPAVYANADISEPSPPSKKPAPPTPFEVGATVGTDGAVTVTWKNSDAEGTAYLLYRQVNGAGPFTLITTVTGEKRYKDEDVQVGTTTALYLIVAQRNGLESEPSAPAYVRLGVAGAEAQGQQPGEQAESA